MHAVGVIHRDLKPSNVLMAPHGPKVADFGIAHAADSTALTRSGVSIGSPAWMAPEQATGGVTTPAVHVFAWGATVAFAATGRPPFGEGRPEAVVYRVVHEGPDLRGVDARLHPLVAAALAKDPATRPTPDRLLVRLVQEAVPGISPGGGTENETTVALNWTWHLGSDAALVEPEPVVSRRGRRFAWVAAAAAVALILAGVGYGVTSSRNDHQSTSTAGAPNAPATSSHTAAASTQTAPVSRRASASVSAGSAPSSAAASVLTSPAASTPESGAGTPSPSSSTLAMGLPAGSLPVVACATSFGVNESPPPLPTSMAVSVSRSLAKQLAVYSDADGVLKLLAPRGWSCDAGLGADGSGSVEVYPPGFTPSAGKFAAGARAIVGSETSACTGCREELACRLFTTAANDYLQDYQAACPSAKPAGESTFQLQPGVVGFEDPPGVAGDGDPSGGDYPANGVMTYHSGNPNGSWLETCTLPATDHAICTAVLNNFVDAYGTN
jgi:hypothetical protein